MKRNRVIQRGSVIPLYFQVESSLRTRISSGEFRPGQYLPSEKDLALEYGVSRITVRQAMSTLADEGLVVRIRGKGTFVSKRPLGVESARFSGSFDDLVAMGARTKVKILGMAMVEPNRTLRDIFQLDDGDMVLQIEKIRQVEDSPFSLVVNYLPRDIGERVQRHDLTQKPLMTILEEDLGIEPKTASQTIEAAAASPEVADALAIDMGAPLLKVERTLFDKSGTAVAYVSVLYRSDKYLFTVELSW